MEQTAEKQKMDEITIKFGKGCVGEPFTGKDGKEYKQILIPNKDENDHSPWATFVARSNAVHEDQFGKGMWMKLPADGHTTVRKDHCVGEGADGKKIWETEKTKVSNTVILAYCGTTVGRQFHPHALSKLILMYRI